MSSIVTEIHENVNLLDLLDKYNISYKRVGRSFQCHCPFHEDKIPSFSIDLDRNRYHCFGSCNRDFDAIDFVKEIDKCDFKEAIETLKSMFYLNSTTKTRKVMAPPKNSKKEIRFLPHYQLATAEPLPLSTRENRTKLGKNVPENTVYQVITQYIYLDLPETKIIKTKYEFYGSDDIRLGKSFSWSKKSLIDGKWVNQKGLSEFKGEIPLYRINETLKQDLEGKIIIFVEGEKDCELLWNLGMVALCYGTSPNLDDFTTLKNKGINGIAIFRDNDETGITKANKISNICDDLQIPCEIVNIAFDMTEGSDVSDFYQKWVLENPTQDFLEYLKQFLKCSKVIANTIQEETFTQPEVAQPQPQTQTESTQKLNFTQQAFLDLYSGYYISIDDKLYQFQKTHYVVCNEGIEKKRITQWCENYSSKRAEKRHVQNIWEWVLLKTAIAPDKINPGGLNLLNGTLIIEWDNQSRGKIKIVPHNPNVVYTYCCEVRHDPSANDYHCQKLLECLDESARKIFLRTIASSLDLPYLRTKRARESKALILCGSGSNGKDALRSVCAVLFNNVLTKVSLADFQGYDRGEKNQIANLEGSLINWCSENVAVGSLDIQSLKAAITGDSLDYKRLYQEISEFTPRGIFLFNCNETPNIRSDLEALKSRFGVICFTKTYKSRPNTEAGELQADPRYKDDSNFIKENIAPAFLNLLIKELEDLAIAGIDYSSIEQNLDELKRKSCHLFQFCSEVGIVKDFNGRIYLNDLWELLRNWYISNGTLEIEETDKGKQKSIWHDQANKYDKSIKAPNQLRQRFTDLFPHIIWGKESANQDKRGQAYLQGISLSVQAATNPIEIENCPPSESIDFDVIYRFVETHDLPYQDLLRLFMLLNEKVDQKETILDHIRDEIFIARDKETLTQIKETYGKKDVAEVWARIKEYHPDKMAQIKALCS